MKGATTCKVCGRDFPLIIEEHYVAQDPQKIGVLANLANTDKAIEYDAFDCPHCGCQNVMQTRKPLWLPEICECEEDQEDQDEESDIKTIADMRKFLINFCEVRHCEGCPLDKRGFLCGRGYTFRSDIPGSFGYLSDEEIKRHYEVVKEDK